MTTRTCRECNQILELNDTNFYRNGSRNTNKIYWTRDCKICYSKKAYERQRNRSKETLKGYALKSKYGITLKQYKDILKSQNNKCAICEKDYIETEGDRSWHLDHDHACCPTVKTCGECIRGILCINCNMALGNIKDDLYLLERMKNYILANSI